MPTDAKQSTVSTVAEPDVLARRLLAIQLHRLGLAHIGDLRRFGHATPDYFHRWLAESLRYVAGIEPGDADAAWRQWDARQAHWREDNDLAARARLLDACLRSLPAVLTGEKTATSVIFPDGSMALVEGIYRHNRIADYFNQVLSEAVLAWLESRNADAEPLRILEIGAGTGGVTAGLLAALTPWWRQIDEYCYTDLSQAFLQHGAEAFGRDHRFLQTRLFDVSRPGVEQGIPGGHYHLALASNVLHATPDVHQSLRNIKAVLRTDGWLLLNEISMSSLFTHLSFGLLEGWWHYRDGALRLPGCPGLSPASWQAVLMREGFNPVLFPAEAAHALGQQIILAENDGIERQPAAERNDADDWRRRVGEYLRGLVAETLKIPAGQMSLSRPLTDYGLDSILVVRLTQTFNQYFKNVDSALFFEIPTLMALTEHFILQRPRELERLLDGEPVARQRLPERCRRQSVDSRFYGNDEAEEHDIGRGSVPGGKVAIIGVDGRFPGAASMRAFWLNLAGGHCAIGEIPAERWDWRRYFDPEPGKAGHLYTRWGGFLADVDRFDPAFFHLSRREAERMDPRERLFLQVAWHCIEDAGYNPATLSRQGEVGVFVGAMNGGYHPIHRDWSIANRVSYQLDLRGPSLVVDSACSSSLTAIHLALESLANGNCALAIAGGVNLIVNPHHYLGLCEMTMLSPGERCSAFGADADGFVAGEGVGAVLLKPLELAIAAGDPIYAVIAGSAINAGGKTNGYTVPGASAQQRVLEQALARAGVDAGRVSYIEAHGTGTALGDPIEISGLSRVFESGNRCAIGSVKSNIGHGESAAGIAGLCKVLLQLKYRQLAPTLHAEPANPKIDFERTPLCLQRQLAPWQANGATRLAAISSFGAGGANAALIVEEYTDTADPRPAAPGPWLVPLSARDPARLAESVSCLLAFLDGETPTPEMADLAYTLQVGREAMAERLALLADSVTDLRRRLACWRPGAPTGNVFEGHAELLDAPLSAETSGALDQLAALWVRGGMIDWDRLWPDGAYRRPRRISLPGYPFAADRYWQPGLAHPQAPDPPEAVAEHVCFLPCWQPQAAVEAPAAPGAGAVLLVAMEPGGATSGRLLEMLTDHYRASRDVVHIDCIAGASAEVAAGHWRCGHDDPQGFAHILPALGALAQIMVIGPEIRPDITARMLVDSPRYHEFPLLRLFRALPADADLACFLLSQGRSAFAGAPHAGNPLGAGMTGLGYALAQSSPGVRLRNLDIQPAELESREGRQRLLAQMLAEPASERGEAVMLRQGERFVRQLTPLALPAIDDSASALKPQGVYLILGGAGVIGQVISRQLIGHYQARVVWLGRTAADSPEIRQSLAAAQFQGRVDYIQADATDPAQLRQAVAQVRQRYGRIHGALFCALVFDFDNSLRQTTETQFRRIFEVKSLGSLHFYQALADQPLDFLCYFSSGQGFGFSGAANLSAYACGITFADAAVGALRPLAPFPVGVINWGFWRAALQTRPVSSHMDALDDDEGFDCFRRFVAQLSSGAVARVLCVKASVAVRQLMAVPQGRQYRLDPPGVPVPLEPAEPPHLPQMPDPHALDQSIAAMLLIQLQALGAFSASGRQCASIVDRFGRWRDECLAILLAQGLIVRQGEVLRLAQPIDDARRARIQTAWREQCQRCLQDRDQRARVALIDDCLQQLPQILSGRVRATDVLFPDGSMAKVEGVFKDNAWSDYFNTQLASLVSGHVRRLLAAQPGRALRILEIGAGTGGASAALLAALDPLAGQIGEYCYSDISPAFLRHGEHCFAAGRPFFTTRMLDISQPPARSGYDIVIASNVLHATANLRRTLTHAKALLCGGGLLVLNELTRKTLAATVTFGLLDGWWLYEDPQLRIPGSPLLAEERWPELLWSEGFGQVGLHVGPGLGQQIISARSDGVIAVLSENGPLHRSEEPQALPLSDPRAGAIGHNPELQPLIIDTLARTLKADRDSIAPRTPFADYGVDSILGVSFVKQLGQQLGIRLNSAILFEQSTVAKLCDYLQKTHGEQIRPSPGAAPMTTGTTGRIAIIGMSGQFPGAGDIDALWDSLLAGRCSVQDLPEAYLDPRTDCACRRAGILRDRDCFDPLFFSLTPHEAMSMSPHQRLVMQEGWKALEDAGYDPLTLAGRAVSVYVGAEPGGYRHESFTGGSEAIVASRLSYFLDFKGPAMVINTGCSSSGVAIHQACQSLRLGESCMALAGGVYALLDQRGLVSLSAIDMLSPGGQCRVFDAGADGTVISEGVGMLVLKRLEDAEADHDPIHGVIEASGLNQDGASNGITAPNGEAQEQLIRATCQQFGIDPARISYVEAHGTGTRLGDPVEANALIRAYRPFCHAAGFCALGSAKANLGHTAAAAGVIGLIKILLSMQHRALPAMPGFEQINPLIELDGSPFYINREAIDWMAPQGERRLAALNSFGHSGTNAHLVIGEYQAEPAVSPCGALPAASRIFPLSAKTADSLRDNARALARWLERNPSAAGRLADIAFTLQTARTPMRVRAVLVADELAQLQALLARWSHGEAPALPQDEPGRLAAGWADGAETDWAALWPVGTARRIHLPGYQFAKERYWADRLPPVAMNVESAEAGDQLSTAILQRLTAVFCSVTRLPAGRIEPDAPLQQYGIDSIMITRLNRALDEVFSRMTALAPAERQLSKTLFFEYHSLAALADALVARYPRACRLWSGQGPLAHPAPQAAEPIAVIGMSGRYPQAANLDEFWRNLQSGRDCITEIPAERWPLRDFYVESVTQALKQGKSYSKWGGFIDGFAEFDPQFFNISPREAVNMDPQERLFLQSCWHALEDAGITRATLAEYYQGNVGVFAGITKTGYGLFGPGLREQGHLVFPRTSFGSTANRVSYVLDLNGPSEPVDTQCSSSLSAVHRAVESLRRGECRMAFAGGVNLYLHPANYVELCAGQMLSQDGRCRSFGAGGNGFVPGEGVGVLLLKPLSQALADRDNIHALIRASAVNHGGKTNGYTVPNPHAQARVIRRAIDQAGLRANQISYIEAHGTGTALGDPIELSGLNQAFAADSVGVGRCALGSVKANIGHLEAAAGIAGVSKVILQFRHQQIAPSLHSARPNPDLALEASPFCLQQALGDWHPSDDGARIAGVSSFGAGGANAHVVLQEYEEYREQPDSSGAEMILLSARDGERLRDYAGALLAYVEARPQMTGADLANLAYTLQTGRETMAARLGWLVDSPAELANRLRAYVANGDPPDNGGAGSDRQRSLLARWLDGAAIDGATLSAGRSGPRPCRISLPVYPFARETFWLPGRVRDASDGLSYLARWMPEPYDGASLTGAHHCVLIVAGPTAKAVADAIAASYLAQARRVIRLEPGQCSRALATDYWSLDVNDPQAIDRCLAGIQGIDSFYFIGGAGEADDWPALLDSPQSNEILLLRLIRWLKSQECPTLDGYILSQNNFDIAGEPVSAFGGGLTGMAHALAQGEHRFRVRHLDIDHRAQADRGQLAQLVRQLQSEPGLARGEVLCLRDGVRLRRSISRLSWPPAQPGLAHAGVYVILGGAGAVGGVISRYLLADYQAQVIWLGRAPADDPGLRQRLERCLRSVGGAVDPARLEYVQADANDPAALTRAVAQIRQRHGAINGAIFSAVVFGEETSITRISAARFCEIFEVKSRGAINFYRAFANEPLDFLCYFSSAQSFAFSGAAKLPAYAAGITFCDSLAHSLRFAAFPVGALHWGFWHASLAGQPQDSPAAQPMSRHADALEDRAGFECFAHYVAALRGGRRDQVICMAASKPVQQLMRLQPEHVVHTPGDRFERYRAAAAPLLAAHRPGPFDAAMAGMLLDRLRDMGLFGARADFVDSETLRCEAGIDEHYARWWSASLDLLQQHGRIQRRGAQVRAIEPPPRARDDWRTSPGHQARDELLGVCLRQLPAILRGQIPATDVMFPGASMDNVEGVYRNNPVSDFFNQTLASEVRRYIGERLARDPQCRIRILEIGAGTGGATASVLPALADWRGQIAEYCYTDISKAFLMYARKTYGAANPFLAYQLWNVEQAPESGGLERGGYDIVIAAHVLHATRNIRRTLRHVRQVLRHGGILLLCEISDRSLFSHLTFGLLKGWWLYEDPELRIPATPALSPESWARVLADAGLSHVAFPAACAHALGQQVIVAENHGAAAGEGSRAALTALTLDGLARTLQLDPARIAPDRALADYGIDSILGVSFVGYLGEALGIELNSALLFDYPTPERLVDYLLAQYPAQCARLDDGAAPQHPSTDQLEDRFMSAELSVDALLNLVRESGIKE